MIFIVSIESLFGRVQENQEGFKLNEAHQLLSYKY
jgi:hypothetical protein